MKLSPQITQINTDYKKISHEVTQRGTKRGKLGSWEDKKLGKNKKKRKKNLCNLRNLWFLIFIRLRATARRHERLARKLNIFVGCTIQFGNKF